MVDVDLEAGENHVLQIQRKTERRRHGEIFGSISEVLSIMDEGEMAVVVMTDSKKKTLMLYGQPTKDVDVVAKLRVEAQTLGYSMIRAIGKNLSRITSY